MASYRFFRMATIESEIYFRVRFWWWHSFGKMEIYWYTKFDEISQSTGEIKLLPVSENGRPPYWNSISGFYFYLIFVIGLSFCIGLPNFVKIELPLAQLWRHIDFFKTATRSHIGFDSDNIRPPTKCNRWFRLVLKLGISTCFAIFGDLGGHISPRWRHPSS